MNPLEIRFWSKVRIGDGCWIWSAHVKTPQRVRGRPSVLPYGQFWHNGRARRSHVVAFELTNGPVPAGCVVGHKCDNATCVRPSHLEAVTQSQNVRATVERGRRKVQP
jgi:hypothetical protein